MQEGMENTRYKRKNIQYKTGKQGGRREKLYKVYFSNRQEGLG